jgi:putative PIN family toxin of toxin-antitoxin system
MRGVVDTNVWISALLNPAGAPAAVRKALEAGLFDLVISRPMVDELGRVAARPRLVRRFGLTPEETADLMALVEERAEFVPVTGTVRLCRDPDDDVVIETALNGRADVLVTRDDDLKGESELVAVLRERGVAVVTVRQFLAMLGAPPA